MRHATCHPGLTWALHTCQEEVWYMACLVRQGPKAEDLVPTISGRHTEMRVSSAPVPNILLALPCADLHLSDLPFYYL